MTVKHTLINRIINKKETAILIKLTIYYYFMVICIVLPLIYAN